MMNNWKYPAAALLLGAALALWPVRTAEASALTGLSTEYTRCEAEYTRGRAEYAQVGTEYARGETSGQIPAAGAAVSERMPGKILPVSAFSDASDASDGSAAVKKAASALRGHQDPLSLSGSSKEASKESTPKSSEESSHKSAKESSKGSGEKKPGSKFQLPQFLRDYHFDPDNEKKELGKAISKLDELGISPEKLVGRFWDFITHKENLEKIGKTAQDLKENAGELIEKATGGNDDSGTKSEKSGSGDSGSKSDGAGKNSGNKSGGAGEDSGNKSDDGSVSAEEDRGNDIDRVTDKVKEEVNRKAEKAIDKAAETAGEIAAREIDKAAETAGELVGQEIDKAAEKVKKEAGKIKK